MIDGPISLRLPALSFDELARLHDVTDEILASAAESLEAYRDVTSGGYFHVLDPDASPKGNDPGDFSKASTSTVVPFLIRAGRWDDVVGADNTVAAAGKLLELVLIPGGWTSAGLDPDNPFTVAFLLELADALLEAGAPLSTAQKDLCAEKLAVLRGSLEEEGRVHIEYEPPRKAELPNSYLTQLVMRVLALWDRRAVLPKGPALTDELIGKCWSAALASINTEVARHQADPLGADFFELGYALLIANDYGAARLRPEHRQLLRHALDLFFASQRPDGSWPRGRRLFQYPTYGNAYCYEYEFLAQLLASLADTHVLLPYLANLQRSVDRLTNEAIALPSGGFGWASGHHRQLVYPESWSTASGFDVCHRLHRFVADGVTDTILQNLGQTRLAAASPSANKLEALLDSEVHLPNGDVKSLKGVLRDRFAQRIAAQAGRVKDGKPLTPGTPLSAILYGPPGTSKTTYAAAIASFIGWDLVTIDPSHLLRSGFDGVQLEVNKLFRMLLYAERVVVFFDEIDELLRDRFGKAEEAASRFSTTSMLPRLGKLRESRRVIFLVATNHLEVFDAAIARLGRFDLVVPVMPPTAEEKLRVWPPVGKRLRDYGLEADPEKMEWIGDLTFSEFEALAPELIKASDEAEFVSALRQASAVATINQKINDTETWCDLMKQQESKARV